MTHQQQTEKGADMVTNKTNSENQGCSLRSFERNQYFYGKLLTVRDFDLEQRYSIEKSHLLNRLILGEGIVCGLEVKPDIKLEKDTLTIYLSKGIALDCCGREIIVSQGKSWHLDVQARGRNYIYLKYDERDKEPVPDVANGSSWEGNTSYSRVEETYSVFLSKEPPAAQIKGRVAANGDSKSNFISGAKVEALDTETETVKSVTFSDAEGNYRLLVPEGTYKVRASASGFETQTSEETTADLDDEDEGENLPLSLASAKADESPSQDLVQQYYNDYLRTYSECHSSKILLAVVDIPQKEGELQLLEQETQKYRKIVCSNQMLIDILREIKPAISNSLANNRVRLFTGIQELEFEKTDDASRRGSLVPVKVTVDGLQKEEAFSVALAPILPADIPPILSSPLEGQEEGIHFVFGSNPQLPRTYVAYVPLPYNQTFEIHGFDPNLVDKQEKVKVVYWVTTGAEPVKEPPSLGEKILEILKDNSEGITLATLSKRLGVERSTVDSELQQMVQAGTIQRVNGTRYIAVEHEQPKS